MLSSGKCNYFWQSSCIINSVFILFYLLESIIYIAKALNGGNDRSMGEENPRVHTTRAALFFETLICGGEQFLVSCGAPSERFIVRYAKEEQMNLSTTQRKPKRNGANFGGQTLSSVSQCSNFPLTKLCHVTNNEKKIFMVLCLGSQSLLRRLNY